MCKVSFEVHKLRVTSNIIPLMQHHHHHILWYWCCFLLLLLLLLMLPCYLFKDYSWHRLALCWYCIIVRFLWDIVFMD